MRTLLISLICLFCCLGPTAVFAESALEASLALHNVELARWQTQADAAQRDVELTDRVLEAFFFATGAEPDDPKEVTAALEPLRARFPDVGLRYSGEADYCRVQRTIRSARDSASQRLIEAAQNRRETAGRQVIISEISMEEILSGMGSRPLSVEKIADAFNSALRRRKDKIATDWSSIDYETDLSRDRCD